MLVDHSFVGIADLRRGLDQRVQNGFEFRAGLTDDLKHLACRGLIFERLFQIAGALAQFAQQPRVLHRDDRLRCKVLQQRDVLLRKWAYLISANDKGAYCSTVLPHCDPDDSPYTGRNHMRRSGNFP